MENFLLISDKDWCSKMTTDLKKNSDYKFHSIQENNELNMENIRSIKPKMIFVPHWSKIIPEEIYSNYQTVIFHMTDLPYGRGGSPLQNLIVRGHKETFISALKCAKKIDAGPIYLKKFLSLKGTADDIFRRAYHVIMEMIIEIIKSNPKPQKQEGAATYFERRSPEDGNLINASSINQIYDFIRMLDSDEYPPAYLKFGKYFATFQEADIENECVIAKVKIKRLKNE